MRPVPGVPAPPETPVSLRRDHGAGFPGRIAEKRAATLEKLIASAPDFSLDLSGNNLRERRQSMDTFDIAATLLSIAAVFGYINHRCFKLPTTIGVMLMTLATSLGIILIGVWSAPLREAAVAIVGQVDFNLALMKCMLCFLLFAGALHVDLNDLASRKFIIAAMATLGVFISTFIVGTAFYFLLSSLGRGLDYVSCLLFGALISPTDPVAVLGILKKAGVPKSLETKITGESLFNDGVGVVVFVVLLGIATGSAPLSFASVLHIVALDAAGGIIFGLGLGFLGYYMLKSIENYQMEVLITLALVTGGYSLATHLHVSGPLAMVVAGLMIGNHGRAFAMSQSTREHLDTFWELVDEVLNAILFTLIGFELIVINLTPANLAIGFIAIPVVLAARLVAVAVPVTLLKTFRTFSPGVIRLLTWGGLRGGISVALALALPREAGRDLFLTATYVVVIFSIAVQGLTLKKAIVRVET